MGKKEAIGAECIGGKNSMVDDPFSPHFNLFVLYPNGQHDTAANRSMYLPHSRCDSPVAMQMYKPVGELLGDRRHLKDMDAMFMQIIDGIRNCESDGISHQEEFERASQNEGLDSRVTAFDCTEKEVEFIANGKEFSVTFESRQECCALEEQYLLREATVQISATARGIRMCVSSTRGHAISLEKMELLTCGSPRIDIAMWRQHTRYEGFTESNDTVQLFWKALEQFLDEQRSDFVRFAWGRSRLPPGKLLRHATLIFRCSRQS